MDLSAVLPAVFGLIGVALGAVGSLLAQHSVNRTAETRLRQERLESERAERKAVIFTFLEVAQQLEELLGSALLPSAPPDARVALPVKAVLHRLWVLEKQIDMLCGDACRNAARELTGGYHHLVWDGVPKDSTDYEFINPRRQAFLEAARSDLDRSQSN